MLLGRCIYTGAYDLVLTGLEPLKSTAVEGRVHPCYRNFASRERRQLLGQTQQILRGVRWELRWRWQIIGNIWIIVVRR
jgi:hypothetical protein